MVLNGAIIQHWMLGPGLNKGGSPLPVEQEHRGEGAVPHLPPLMVRLQEVPSSPSSSLWFLPPLIFSSPSWVDIFPHWGQSESGSFLSWLLVHFCCRDTAEPGGRCRDGGGAGGVKGLVHPRGTPTSAPDLGCLPPRKINFDKWALLSAFDTLTWYQQLARSSSPRPPAPLGRLLSTWRSHWRKCQLNLRSLVAVHLLPPVTWDLRQRASSVFRNN